MDILSFQYIKRSHLENLVLLAILSLVLGSYPFIMNLLIINTGVGELPYPRLYLQILPGLYIFHNSFRKQSFKMPHFVLFIVTIALFILFESYLSLSYGDYPNYEVLWQMLNMYIFFLMLVNFGSSREAFYRVIDLVFYSCLFIAVMSSAGYMGLFKITDIFDYQEVTLSGDKPSHLLHVDIASYLYCLSFLALIIKQLNEKAFSPVYLVRDFVVAVFLFGLITVSSSRGPSLVFIIFSFYYCGFLWRNGLKDKRIKIATASLVIILFTISAGNFLALLGEQSELSLVKRFYTYEANSSVRLINNLNNWQNFLEHPFTGVGYENAAVRDGIGTVNNNQYLQLLASSGIVYLVIFIYFNFRFFIGRLSLLKVPPVTLSFILCFAMISLERLIEFLAVPGYIAFYFYSVQPKSAKKSLFRKILNKGADNIPLAPAS